MDAQNAARPDKTKPAPAAAASDSNKRPDHVPDHKRPATSASAKPAVAASKPTSIADKDAKTNASPSADAGDDRGTVDGASSDAETIVLPGKMATHLPRSDANAPSHPDSDSDNPVTDRPKYPRTGQKLTSLSPINGRRPRWSLRMKRNNGRHGASGPLLPQLVRLEPTRTLRNMAEKYNVPQNPLTKQAPTVDLSPHILALIAAALPPSCRLNPRLA
ncbi:unnamed protein product [Parascedosporium putredinis]|uniref:Uncharacterized protein n=1 Tax=Parascedosporium putredinis TaxID=1442378 RepID=A0A9P1H9C6_9PEZI|nr:unnamed protein product [Parascedosporium putredinis]CAI8000822.1 unnamed protein product [Parascedosporium putredinis]